MFAVQRHGSEQSSDVGQVRSATSTAVAVWRHRAGRGRGGGPRRSVSGV